MASGKMGSAKNRKEALTRPRAGNHFVQVYQDLDILADSVCHFLNDQLQPTEAAVIIATTQHREAFKARFIAQGIDLDEPTQRRQYRYFDAEMLLSSFMVNGMPDIESCKKSIGAIFEQISQEYKTARVYGEMVDILWQQGLKDAAVALEHYWNELLKQYSFSLLCTYHIDNLDPSSYNGALECLCSTHTHFIPSQDFALLEEALANASDNVMGVSLKGMVNSIGKVPHPTTIMPPSQASLLYISKTMPTTTEFILNQVRSNLAKPDEHSS